MLIDLRATHNFIDEGFVSKKELNTEGFEGFQVTNVNEKIILYEKTMKKFGVKIQDYVTSEDLYVYPLDGFPNLILGVQ